MTIFLHTPERLAGYPITALEAADLFLEALVPDEVTRLYLPAEKRLKYHHLIKRALLLGLGGGGLRAYVQSPSIAAWYRIPSEYWFDVVAADGKFEQVADALPLPDTLQSREGVKLPSDDLVGQPVVLWREEVTAYRQRSLELAGKLIAREPDTGLEDTPGQGVQVVSTAAAIKECASWLSSQFDNPEFPRKKPEIKALALARYAGRLSGRGFNTAWSSVAPPDRAKPGRKSRN